MATSIHKWFTVTTLYIFLVEVTCQGFQSFDDSNRHDFTHEVPNSHIPSDNTRQPYPEPNFPQFPDFPGLSGESSINDHNGHDEDNDRGLPLSIKPDDQSEHLSERSGITNDYKLPSALSFLPFGDDRSTSDILNSPSNVMSPDDISHYSPSGKDISGDVVASGETTVESVSTSSPESTESTSTVATTEHPLSTEATTSTTSFPDKNTSLMQLMDPAIRILGSIPLQTGSTIVDTSSETSNQSIPEEGPVPSSGTVTPMSPERTMSYFDSHTSPEAPFTYDDNVTESNITAHGNTSFVQKNESDIGQATTQSTIVDYESNAGNITTEDYIDNSSMLSMSSQSAIVDDEQPQFSISTERDVTDTTEVMVSGPDISTVLPGTTISPNSRKLDIDITDMITNNSNIMSDDPGIVKYSLDITTNGPDIVTESSNDNSEVVTTPEMTQSSRVDADVLTESPEDTKGVTVDQTSIVTSSPEVTTMDLPDITSSTGQSDELLDGILSTNHPPSTNVIPDLSTTVVVKVHKQFKTTPVFENAPYEAPIPGDATSGYTVFSDIVVTNFGSSVNVSCESYIQFPDICDHFSVIEVKMEENRWLGSLVLLKPLPIPSKTIYQVKLVATNGFRNATTTITALEQASNETLLGVHKNHFDLPQNGSQMKPNSAPKFIYETQNNTFTINVSESLPSGSSIPGVHLTVTDDDSGPNGFFNLTVLDPSGTFNVQPTTIYKSANISFRLNTIAKLDYEDLEYQNIVFLVEAIETEANPSLSSMAVITVNVIDANDNLPEFEEESYTRKISENSPAGVVVARINASDKDSGMFGTEGIRYSLRGRHNEFFQIDSLTGTVTVAPCMSNHQPSCLDYEEQSHFVMVVTATDDGGNGLSTEVPLVVELVDMNDNPPKFTQNSYATEMKIGDERFSPPLFVKAIDSDPTSIISYSIMDSPTEVFVLDPQTGELLISNSSTLNVSELLNHKVIVTVKASDEDNQYDVALINVTIEDENTYIPAFELPTYESTISDASLPGAFVAQVSASDDDFASGGQLLYKLQFGNQGNFAIDSSTGVISVSDSAHLDYDQQNHYEIQVVAIDGGTPSRTGTATLLVNITDGNNKSPYFDPPIQRGYVKEDAVIGHVVHRLTAVDPDVQTPGLLKYLAQDPVTLFDRNGNKKTMFKKQMELFYIDDSSGEVKLASPITRSTASIVVITVIAIDTSVEPVQTGKGTLIISVVGETNHFPVFPQPWSPQDPNLSVDLKENLPINTFLLSLGVADPESSSQKYKIDPLSPYVSVDPVTGILVTKAPIDFEEMKSLSFHVTAFETDHPSYSLTANITVNIIDENDNEPQFSQSEYHFLVEENSMSGTVVGIVNATDIDSGKLGEITYTIEGNGGDLFTIDGDGVITITSENPDLDRESHYEFIFELVATDRDPEPESRKSIRVPLFIGLSDVNDNAPRFVSRDYRAFIIPVKHSGSPLLQVFATDDDNGINGSIAYSIDGGNDDGMFWINQTSGIIYVGSKAPSGILEYQLQVAARDQNGKGPHADFTTVVIQLLEMNAHSPQFVSPNETELTVTENQPEGLLVQVKAEDFDSGTNGVISYHFLDDNQMEVLDISNFTIDSGTGMVRVTGPLDRELKDRYQLLVRARDKGQPHPLETLRVLNVRVLDENDNQPAFPIGSFSNPYSFSVSENAPIRTAIGQLSASDPDEGINGQIFYSIIDGNEAEHFIIDSENGILRTNVVLDHENKNAYKLLVQASNNSPINMNGPIVRRSVTDGNTSTIPNEEPFDRSVATVQIKIKNSNDNPPQFVGLPYQIGVKYSAEIGEFVTQVKAEDPDGDNVTYSLLSSHLYRSKSQISSGAVVPQPFSIDRSGHIHTTAPLVFYNQDRFHLTVVAKEETEPYQETKAIVEVWVYEQSQLLRVVIAFPPEIVTKELPDFVSMLSNLTQGKVYTNDIRYHTNKQNEIDKDSTDILIHVVDRKENVIKSVSNVLDTVDNTFNYYPEYKKLHLTSVEPVITAVKEEPFNPALATLIALLVVLFIGFLIVVIICCSTQCWVKRKDVVAVRRKIMNVVDPTTAIDNPLWIEKKLKPYEEQELSMQVFSDLVDPRFAPLHKNQSRLHGSLGNASILEAAMTMGDEYVPMEEKPDKGKKQFTPVVSKSNKYKELRPQPSELSVNSSVSSFPYQPANGSNFTNSTQLTSEDKIPKTQFKFNKNGEPVMVGELL